MPTSKRVDATLLVEEFTFNERVAHIPTAFIGDMGHASGQVFQVGITHEQGSPHKLVVINTITGRMAHVHISPLIEAVAGAMVRGN